MSFGLYPKKLRETWYFLGLYPEKLSDIDDCLGL